MNTLPDMPLRAKKLHEHVTEHLERLILRGALKPGDSLPTERELMKTFGIGRPAVREALLVLEQHGMVALRSGSPARVTAVTLEGIAENMEVSMRRLSHADDKAFDELMFVRMVMETSLVRLAAEERSPTLLSALREVHGQSLRKPQDAGVFSRLDSDFHFTIVRLSNNRFFEIIYRSIFDWVRELRKYSLMVPRQYETAIGGHAAVLEAIEAGDKDGAEQAMRRHLEQVRENFRRALAALRTEGDVPRDETGEVRRA